MIIQKLSNLDSFMESGTNIDGYLTRVERGQDVVYRTTFYKGKDVKQVLSDWTKRLNTIKAEYPSLLAFENDLLKKVGPTSVMEPLVNRIPDVESYYTSVEKQAQALDPRAFEACLNEWSAVQADDLVCRDQVSTVKHMKLSTNSGAPYFTKRRDVVDFTVPSKVVWDKDKVYQVLPRTTKEVAAILGWRGQEGGPDVDDVKQRVVWMFPFALNVLEQQLYQPLIASFQRHKLVPAWVSNDLVDAEVTKLFDTKSSDDLVICTDFTKFDQHFNPTLSDAARTLISELVRSDGRNARWFEEVFPVKYMIPMILSSHLASFGKHGMASGSGGTNFDETLVHRALQHEAACMHGSELNVHSMCLGDDGIISYPGATVDQIIDTYTKHGLEMNVDKQYAANDHCVYLRRWHHQDYRINDVCVGVYSTYRALGRLMYQERYYDPKKWGPKMVALRQLSILENVKYHPLRDKFAEYCMRGDKYRLGIDIPGFLVNIEREAKEATDMLEDFMGYNRSVMESKTPITEWWIVKFLQSRA